MVVLGQDRSVLRGQQGLGFCAVKVGLIQGDLSVKERAVGQKGFGCRERSGCVETGLRGDGSMGVMIGDCGRLGVEVHRVVGASWERSGSNGMWMLSAPVGEYGMFVMQRHPLGG